MNNRLNKHDLNFCVRRLPAYLIDIMKNASGLNTVFVGGGFIRSVITNEDINDIDVFTLNKTQAQTIADILQHAAPQGKKNYRTENAITVKTPTPIQIIHRWTFEKPEDVAKSFDFTICSAVIWVSGIDETGKPVWESYCDDTFYEDLAAKRLVYRSPVREEEPGGSILRVLKYYQKGYRIPLDSFGSVITRLIRKIDFKQEPSEQRLAEIITGMLVEVDPNADPNRSAHLPSQKSLENF